MHRNRGIFLIFLSLSASLLFTDSPAFGQRIFEQGPGGEKSANGPLRTAKDRVVGITNIRLDVKVDLEQKAVESKATLDFYCIQPTTSVSLDAVDFQINRVELKEGNEPPKNVPFKHDGKKLLVELGSLWKPSRSGTLLVSYRVQTPKQGLHFFAPSKEHPDEPLEMWSQGETDENRYWIPCIDEPEQRQTTEVVATVPEDCEAVSNGRLVERKENADKTVTFDWKQEIPHASYLIALVVGHYDVVTEDWEGIPLMYYVPKGRKAEALPTYGRTREMLTCFSKRFGIRYPWAKYAQISVYQFGGGMENTSATTMFDGLLVDEKALQDRNPDSIVSHELGHQWWGDMVTCRDWSHTWLNEGFASYCEALWDEHKHGSDEYAFNMYEKANGAISGGRERPVVDLHYPDPDKMFDARVYPKGAWVLHMLRRHLGDEAFFKGINLYGTEHKFQSVETFDFRRSMERATQRDLERFFYDWLERPGNPALEANVGASPDGKELQIVFKQTQKEEEFHFPVKVVVHCSDTPERTVIEKEMTSKELTVRVPLAGTLLRVDIDPDQAILTHLKTTQSDALWQAQLVSGPDVAARLRAVQHFAGDKKDENRALIAKAFANEKFWAVSIEEAKALGNLGGNVCRDALLTGLQHLDPRVRRASVDALASFHGDASVVAALKEILSNGDKSYAVEGAALGAYTKMKQPDAVAQIAPWLSKPSFEDTLARDALRALGETRDPAALPFLLEWSKSEHSRHARTAAQLALIPMAENKELTDAQRRELVASLVDALKTSSGFERFRILTAIPKLGPLAKEALPALDELARVSNGRFKGAVMRVTEEIRKSAKSNGEVR